jgi:hypothetical protein
MLNTAHMSPGILEDIKENLDIDTMGVEALSVEEAFSAYCNWNGLINWGPTLMRVVRQLEEAEIQQEKI